MAKTIREMVVILNNSLSLVGLSVAFLRGFALLPGISRRCSVFVGILDARVRTFFTYRADQHVPAMKPGKQSAANSQMKSFQFTVFAAENGYRVRVKYGEEEYVWPEVYKTLEQAGIEILKALTTASQSRGEELSEG
jgi:hypothetical protein